MSKTEVKLNEGERIDPLGGGYSIVVSKDHIFGTDAVLLADFSKIRKNDTACDLGVFAAHCCNIADEVGFGLHTCNDT